MGESVLSDRDQMSPITEIIADLCSVFVQTSNEIAEIEAVNLSILYNDLNGERRIFTKRNNKMSRDNLFDIIIHYIEKEELEQDVTTYFTVKLINDFTNQQKHTENLKNLGIIKTVKF